MDRTLRLVRPPSAEERAAASGTDSEDQRARRELVAGLQARAEWAPPALVARYGKHVRRVLMRVLGAGDSESADVFQEVMTAAWQGIDRLDDPLALPAWLTRIAVFTARTRLRSRRRRRWLTFFESPPEPAAPWAGPELAEAARAVYDIFDHLPVDERIPLALQMLEGLELEAIAAACGMSLSTVRRRLERGHRRFFKLARHYEALSPWMETER